jgi:hypothetical protein
MRLESKIFWGKAVDSVQRIEEKRFDGEQRED